MPRQNLPPMPTPSQIAKGLAAAGMRPAIPIVNALLSGFKYMSADIMNGLTELLGVNLDRDEEFFMLDFQATPLLVAAGALAVQGTMTVGTEGDFVAVAAMCQAATVATPPVLQDQAVRLTIRDGGTSREFMRNAQPLGFFGQGVTGRPASASALVLSKPRFFARTTQVQFRFDSVAAANVNVDFVFFGYRIFDANQLDLTRARATGEVAA